MSPSRMETQLYGNSIYSISDPRSQVAIPHGDSIVWKLFERRLKPDSFGVAIPHGDSIVWKPSILMLVQTLRQVAIPHGDSIVWKPTYCLSVVKAFVSPSRMETQLYGNVKLATLVVEANTSPSRMETQLYGNSQEISTSGKLIPCRHPAWRLTCMETRRRLLLAVS